MTIRVLVGEDSPLAREGILHALDGADDVDVVGACDNLDALREVIDAEEPDVVLTDIRMPPTKTDEGIRLAAELRHTHPRVGVVILSNHAEVIYAATLFSEGTGGRGYLLKDQVKDRDELLRVLHQVAEGGSYVDAAVMGPKMVDAHSARSQLDPLTPRERTVLRLLAEGKSNAGIAAAIDITVRGVERHVNAIFSKLGLSDGADSNRRVRATLIYLHAAQDE